jgi:hypothetical protein
MPSPDAYKGAPESARCITWLRADSIWSLPTIEAKSRAYVQRQQRIKNSENGRAKHQEILTELAHR